MPLLDDNEWDSTVTVEGYSAKEGEWVDPHMQFVSPGFFETLKIPVMLGRDFTDRDEKGTPLVALINERFAKRYFAGRNPVGLHVGMGGNPGHQDRYRDRRRGQGHRATRACATRSRTNSTVPYRQVEFVQGMTVYARAQGDPTAALRQRCGRAVNELDSNVPIYRMRTMEQQLDKSLMSERLLASLSIVSSDCWPPCWLPIGLYGVMAYMVVRRTREIGIRMALGASRGSVVWLVMREVLLLSAIGVAIGGRWLRTPQRGWYRSSSSASCRPTRSRWCSPPSGIATVAIGVGVPAGAPRHGDRPDAGAALGVAPRCYSRAQIARLGHAPRRTGNEGLRWWIAGLIFLATLINFINRLTISVLAPVITEQLKLSNLEFASITNSFLLAYTAATLSANSTTAWAIGAVSSDRGVVGGGRMLHAFATGLFSLNCYRFLLGLGEAGNWPGAAKVIAEWFPIRQRALGMAIFNSGTSIGSVVAAPLIIALQLALRLAGDVPRGRLARASCGCCSGCAFYHPPDRHPRITRGGAGAHPRGPCGRPLTPTLLARVAALPPDVGDRALALLLRPGVVALHHVAAALSIQGPRLQPEGDRTVRVGAVCGGRRGKPVRRVDVRTFDLAGLDR